MSIQVDDLKKGMFVTVLRHEPKQVTLGGVPFGGPVVVRTESSNMLCGVVLEIVALNLPYIAVKKLSHLGTLKPWVMMLDTRITKLTKVNDEYRKALCEKTR